MNERIFELLNRASDATSISSSGPNQVSFAEKFAELLISAVMAEVKDEVQYQCGWANAEIVENRVKKVFGVEE